MIGSETVRARVATGLLMFVLIGTPIGFQFASFVPLWYFAQGLGAALGIPDQAPVRDHPLGLVWLIAFFAAMLAFQVLGVLLGLWIDRCIMRYAAARGWPDVGGEIGLAFLRGAEGKPKSGAPDSEALNRGDDSLYDPEIDGPA